VSYTTTINKKTRSEKIMAKQTSKKSGNVDKVDKSGNDELTLAKAEKMLAKAEKTLVEAKEARSEAKEAKAEAIEGGDDEEIKEAKEAVTETRKAKKAAQKAVIDAKALVAKMGGKVTTKATKEDPEDEPEEVVKPKVKATKGKATKEPEEVVKPKAKTAKPTKATAKEDPEDDTEEMSGESIVNFANDDTTMQELFGSEDITVEQVSVILFKYLNAGNDTGAENEPEEPEEVDLKALAKAFKKSCFEVDPAELSEDDFKTYLESANMATKKTLKKLSKIFEGQADHEEGDIKYADTFETNINDFVSDITA